MATYINNNVKFHAFSKSPVSPDTTLGGGVNPSGHTITTSQVRSQDIPAFLNTFQGTKEQAITWLGTNYATPAHNDIVYYGGEFKAGFSTPKCLKYNAKAETPAWEDFDITAAATLKNADDKDVIAVHQDCTTVFVDGGNNAATNSNRWSLFVKKSDGSILDHFVASTDKIVAGMPSLGYNALVLWNGAAIDEGELDANYVGNTFAGIVHLNKQYATGDDAKFKVTCFEYIGEKLDTTVADLAAAVFGESGPDDGDTSLTQKVAQNTAAIAKLNGSATETGSVAKTVADAVSAAEGRVKVTTDALQLAIDSIETGVQSVTKAGGSDLLTVGGTATEVTISLSDTVATKTYAESKASEAAAAAEQAAKNEAATNLATARGEITQEIATAKQAAIDNAKVTLTQGTGITVTPNATASTAFTISVDSTIATTDNVATAKSEAIAAAKTETESQVGAAKTELTTAIGTAKTEAINAAASDAASKVAALKTELTTGDGSLGSKVTALEGEVSTIKTTTIPTAKSEAIAAAKTETETQVAALKKTLEEGVIATAQAAAEAAQDTADQAVEDAAAALAEAQAKVASVTITDTTGTITSVGTTTAPAFTVAAGKIEESKLVTGSTVKAHVAAEIAKVNSAADTLAGRVTTAEGKIKTLEETTIPNLKAVSLTKNSGEGLVKVSTVGSIGTGIESITVEVSDTVVETTDTLSATSTGSNNVEVVLGGTIAQPTLTVTGTDIASAQALATLTQTVNTHIEEAAGLYLSVEKVDTLPADAAAKKNKIYLLPLDTDAGREQNIHTEYIWTGSAWEIIGTTAIDINSLEKAADDAQKAADAAQADVNALETTVEELTETVGANKTAAESGISEAKAAAKTAQDEVDELETAVSLLSQTVASNKSTTDAAIAEITGTTIPAITDRLEAIEAIPTVEVVAAEGTEQAPNYVTVSSNTADGKTTFTIASTGALETRLDTLETFVGGSGTPGQGLSELLAKKVDNVTGGSNGITISTSDASNARVATLTVTADTTVTENSTNVVTSGAVFTAVKGALEAAAEAKQIAESKISSVAATTEATHFGSSLVSAITTGTDVVIAVAPAKEWSVGDNKPASTITSVINGKMSDGSTVDDANLTDGSSMFANSQIQTFVGSLGKLTNGTSMFANSSLTEFCADLGSLQDGTSMFAGCTLSEESIVFIVDSLPAYTTGTHTINLGTTVPAELKAEAEGKGWTVA